ncbi:BZ3500_MvSof-1268-A1-R1_Chr9g10687 [Microbotryum saponariae]|uniref:BZ3500_MvSof-1268-A1-R1_Chr9g10687 protein n=1 Tax=Microbotryum saponariae TaxID=289078 RepID=A0A2X0LN63_9BASI|nr:BZ3501_MvSof-1269-A2-R1_Chr9g10435 [Microbotryum saponariae]SDA00523.1 BZ3500_MvSof-1268-A1-R1_Chr9g10687 [Microbotryum saponariae]
MSRIRGHFCPPRLECHDAAPSADSHPAHLTFTSLPSSRHEAEPTSRFTPVGSSSATRCTNDMLSRSQRANLNQENPQHTHRPAATGIITKTPARPSNAAPGQGMLGAGPVLTARHTNKVLGAKDRNGGVGGGLGASFGPAATNKLLVFDASCKPGPSVTVQRVRGSALSPKAVQPVLPDHLRTPSPGVHRYASLSFSPEIVFDSEPDASDETPEEVDLDQDVELAGASARNYEEEFDPGFFISNYADSNLGDVMRGIELGAINADYEVLAAQDEVDRTAFKANLEMGCDDMDQNADSPNYAIFPMPIQRKAFSVKSTNTLSSASMKQPIRIVQVAATKPSGRPASATAQNLRRPPTTGVAGDPSSPWPNRDTRTPNDTAMSHHASTFQAIGAKSAETSRTRPASVASKSSTGRPASRLVPNKTDARDPSLPASSTSSSPAFSLLPSGLRRASNRSVSSSRTLPSNGPASPAAAPAAAHDDAEAALEAFGIVETPLDVFEDEQDLGVDDALSFRLDLDG